MIATENKHRTVMCAMSHQRENCQAGEFNSNHMAIKYCLFYQLGRNAFHILVQICTILYNLCDCDCVISFVKCHKKYNIWIMK